MLNYRVYRWAVCGLSLALASLAVGQEKPVEKPAEKSPKDLFAELDKNKDGSLTADEVGDDKKRFFEHAVRVGDKNKDGKLTADEFAEGVKPEETRPAAPEGGRPGEGRRGGGGAGGDPEELFKRFDVNGDGKLTMAEAPEGVQREFVTRAFQAAGKDKEGTLTKDEFVGALRTAGSPAFEQLDANGDGKLTLEEVPERARSRIAVLFEQAGKGKDGALTKDEYAKVVRETPPPGSGFRGDPEQTFAQLDKNRDDKLTLSEIPEATREFFGRMWDRAGKGRDDAFTKEEFVRLSRTAMATAPREDVETQFKRLDVNGDGKLTVEESEERGRGNVANLLRLAGKERTESLTLDEFRKVRTANPGFGMSGQPPIGFGRLDTNEDGRLSKEELAKAAEIFEELDANKDGQLDPRELAPARSNDRRPDGRPEGQRRRDEREKR